MSEDEHIETATSEDGAKRWQLLRRADGLYAYLEESLVDAVYWADENGGERDVAAPVHWTPTHSSELFETSEFARSDALDVLPWLLPATRLHKGS